MPVEDEDGGHLEDAVVGGQPTRCDSSRSRRTRPSGSPSTSTSSGRVSQSVSIAARSQRSPCHYLTPTDRSANPVSGRHFSHHQSHQSLLYHQLTRINFRDTVLVSHRGGTRATTRWTARDSAVRRALMPAAVAGSIALLLARASPATAVESRRRSPSFAAHTGAAPPPQSRVDSARADGSLARRPTRCSAATPSSASRPATACARPTCSRSTASRPSSIIRPGQVLRLAGATPAASAARRHRSPLARHLHRAEAATR